MPDDDPQPLDPADTEGAKQRGRERGGPNTPPDPGGDNPRREDDDGRGDGSPSP